MAIGLNTGCKNNQHRLVGFFVLFFLAVSISGNGQSKQSNFDWPQWMGPDREGIWHLDIQKDTLKKDDLKKNWEVPIGSGYSGPTVSGGLVYVMDLIKTPEEKERVLCFNLETGEQVWEYSYPVSYSVGYPTGPRASVLIDNGLAYALGTMGELHCMNAITGKVIWKKTQNDYTINVPVWGLSSSPIVEKNQLIVQLGASPDGCIVSFDKTTGKELWRALPDQASYSAPILINQAGKRVVIFWTGDNVVGLNPENGEVYWSVPFKRKGGIINISTPVYAEPYLFLSSFWDGSMLIKLHNDTTMAELVWERAGKNERNTDALHCCISTPIISGTYVYGVDSYGELRCLDLLTGDRIWEDLSLVPFGRWANAHLIPQNNKIWAFNELGELVLTTLSPNGFTDHGRVELLSPVQISPNPRGGVNWAYPAFAGRKIVARSDAQLVCYEVLN
jgi:outer membrane protein assembly factor BamB